MKKFIFVGALLAAVLFMAPDAMAARVRNTQTGRNSWNVAVAENEKKVRVRNLQLGLVANVDLVGVNTGGNTADKNTGCCDTGDDCGYCGCGGPCESTPAEQGMNEIKTGDGDVTLTTTDKVNDNYVDVIQGDSEENDLAENSCTGADSKNIAVVERERRVSVSNTQLGGVLNISAVGVNTGLNSASKNTGGDTSIDTGDAMVNVKHTSTVNTNEVWINQ